MPRFLSALVVSLLFAVKGGQGPSPANSDSGLLVKRIQSGLSGSFPPPEGKPEPGVPHGEYLQTVLSDSKIYPGTRNALQIYVPAQYNPLQPACLLVKLDGFGSYEGTVLDHLIAAREMPVTIALGIQPGTIAAGEQGRDERIVRFNRSYEFDSLNSRLADFILNEALPALEKLKTVDGRALRISASGNDHAAMGASTGGIGSFSLAWQRPDQFSRVYSSIGTFVAMRGGNEYPVLVRKTEPKAIRVFLEDGSDDAWNPLFGSWYEANLQMESALSFAGYDVAHAWGTHGHTDRPGQVVLPDVMRWLWRDYPAPIQKGSSHNSTLQEITTPGETWRRVPREFTNVSAMAADRSGEVYANDSGVSTIYRLEDGGRLSIFERTATPFTSLCIGPDDLLYGLVPAAKQILSIPLHGAPLSRVVAEGLAGQSLLATHTGEIYVNDMSGRLWRIKGSKKTIVEQAMHATAIAFSPSGSLLFGAEEHSPSVSSSTVQADGSIGNKEPFYWLHSAEDLMDRGAKALAVDVHGNLYAATNMGIQVCDQNGRVRAILPLPAPSVQVRGLCFGGAHFDTLYATDGKNVFCRKLKVLGFAPFSVPIAVPSQGAG